MSIRSAMDAAGERCPDTASRAQKKNYAEAFSRALASQFANALRSKFKGILPNESGGKQESPARTSKGLKKLDVNYSTPELGLGLGVSIKTLNFRDGGTKRYTKNYTRIDNELRAEANDYHLRQPFALLVAVVFIPVDCCEDGGTKGISSFGQAVKVFRYRCNRHEPTDLAELMEKIYIGAYVPEGENRGDVWFFDVSQPPPKRGLPRELDRLNFDQLTSAIQILFSKRNDPVFLWADGDT